MKFNYKKLASANHFWEKCTEAQLIEMLQDKIKWLVAHNKNYNNNQYFLILDLQEILTAIESEDEYVQWICNN